MTVTNPEADQEVAALITKSYEMITSHWRAIIPELKVTIAAKPFNRIPQLKSFCDEQNKQPDWKRSEWKYIQVVCPEYDDKEAILWVRFDRQSIMASPDYYLQKEFFAVVAKLMWCISERIRNEAKRYATGMAAQYEGAAYLVFRDTFSRFFLNPEYLRERKEDAWCFISLIDQSLSQARPIPA